MAPERKKVWVSTTVECWQKWRQLSPSDRSTTWRRASPTSDRDEDEGGIKIELEHGHIWCLAHILAHTLGKKKPSLPNLRIYYKILWNKLDFYLSGPRPIRIKPNVGHDPWPLSGPQLTSRIWKFPIKTPTMLNCVAQSLDTTYGQHLSHKCLPNEVKCTVSNQFFIQMNFWPTGKIK